MKFRQSFRNVVLPLKNNIKRSLFHDHDDDFTNSEDSDVENNDDRESSASSIKTFAKKEDKNQHPLSNKYQKNQRKKSTEPDQSEACGKLMACMEKLEKLSKRLEDFSDDEYTQYSKSSSETFSPKQVYA